MTESRHLKALRRAADRIQQSEMIMQYARELYLYGSLARHEEEWNSDVDLFLVLENSGQNNRALKKEIIYLKGDISGDELEEPEVDLKVVFGNAWRESHQIYYRNILREGELLWKKS